MQNSLSPAFVRINYVTVYGPHVMTIPSVAINPDVAQAPSGYEFVLRGLALPVEVDEAVNDFVAILLNFYPPSATFVDYTLFSQPTPEDLPVPVWSGTLGLSGNGFVTSIWDKATESTWSFRADDFTLMKLCLLDSRIGSFDKQVVIAGGSAEADLRDYVTADVTWLASRGGGRPANFLQISKTLNEKLRRSYKMN